MVKVDVLLNDKPVSELAFIAHAAKAKSRAMEVTSKLKENLPRQQFAIKIQVSWTRNNDFTHNLKLLFPLQYHYFTFLLQSSPHNIIYSWLILKTSIFIFRPQLTPES